MNCTYCKKPAAPDTNPPLCVEHADLWLLADYLQEHGRPVTVASLKALRATCLTNGGDITISDTIIETEMAGEFGRQYQSQEVAE